MGELENRNKKRINKSRLQNLVLQTIAAAGVLSATLVAPNVLKNMKKIGILPKSRQEEYVSSAASKLVKKGLVKFNGTYYELTARGRNILSLWSLDNFKFKKPRYWDKKWRMIIFDIPEKKRAIRREVSDLFGKSGLYRLQDSVWIFPYDCEDIIGLLKTEHGIGKDLLYVIADEIENDKYLRSHFDL